MASSMPASSRCSAWLSFFGWAEGDFGEALAPAAGEATGAGAGVGPFPADAPALTAAGLACGAFPRPCALRSRTSA